MIQLNTGRKPKTQFGCPYGLEIHHMFTSVVFANEENVMSDRVQECSSDILCSLEFLSWTNQPLRDVNRFAEGRAGVRKLRISVIVNLTMATF